MSDLCATPETAAHQAPPSLGSQGKNTGVGCHFLLQCIQVKSESEVTQSCLTLSDPMDCSPPDSSIHGIFQARVLERGAIAFSKYQLYFHFKKIAEEEGILRWPCFVPINLLQWHISLIDFPYVETFLFFFNKAFLVMIHF